MGGGGSGGRAGLKGGSGEKKKKKNKKIKKKKKRKKKNAFTQFNKTPWPTEKKGVGGKGDKKSWGNRRGSSVVLLPFSHPEGGGGGGGGGGAKPHPGPVAVKKKKNIFRGPTQGGRGGQKGGRGAYLWLRQRQKKVGAARGEGRTTRPGFVCCGWGKKGARGIDVGPKPFLFAGFLGGDRLF